MEKSKTKLIKSGLLCALVVGLCNTNFYSPATAADYNITSFDELVNNSSAYQSGDILNAAVDFTSVKNVGDIFPAGGEYTLNGKKHIFNGNNKKGFTVNKSTNLTVNEFDNFENFSTSGGGGVFENNGSLIINNSNFSSNNAMKGGAIFNKGSLYINGSKFTNNGNVTSTTYGGAIRSESGILNISNSQFTNNASKNFGGAIATNNTIINITASEFIGNHTDGRGGVMSSNAYTTIRDSVFKNNYSKDYGGVLNVNNDLYVNNSLFEGNYTVDGDRRVNGGAIRSETGNTLINNSTFKGNSAKWGGAISSDQTANLVIVNSWFENNVSDITSSSSSADGAGGAITNGSTLLILNSVFKDNTAYKRGGGVNFNGSVLNIAANGDVKLSDYGNNSTHGGNTIFEGNTVKDGSSNGLQVYQGLDTAPIVNINSGNGGSVIFNDAIVIGDPNDKISPSLREAITLNINKSMNYGDIAGHVYDAPTNGLVVFNNMVGGLTKSVINLYAGTLKIGDNGNFTNVSMNLNGGLLDTRNSKNDVLDFNDFNINQNTNWRMDVDLAGKTSDYLQIDGNASRADGAVLTIETIRLTSDFDEIDRVIGKTKDIYFSNKHFGDSALASLAYDQTILTYVTTNSTYSVSTGYDDNGSKLEFTYDGLGGLPYAVSKDGIRIYSGTGDEKITGWTGDNNLKGDKLIIWGNDYSVTNTSGGELQGLVIGNNGNGSSQTFEINDVNSWSGFSDSYKSQRANGKWDVYGGAFAVLGERTGSIGRLNVDNVNFNNNNVGTSDRPNDYSYGGAISIALSSSTAFANVTNSKFNNNFVVGNDAYGGAMSVTLGNLNIDNTTFEQNASYSTGLHAYGGAIYITHNDSKLSIENSGFYENTVSSFKSNGSYQQANGGAISTAHNGTTSYINLSSFVSNSAEGYKASGGAINNGGTMAIADSYFLYNSAKSTGTALGGAIYNSGNLSLISSTDDFIFSGNYVEKVQKNNDGTLTTVSKDSQALYNTATVNMNSAENQSIIFHDKIDGSNGIINVNKSGVTYTDFTNNFTAPVKGNVILNNTVKNHTINLYNGVLSIGKNPGSLAAGDKYFENVSLNGYGGTFDTKNGQIDNITLQNLTLNQNTSFSFDVDLAARTSDYLTVNGNVSGTGNLVIDTIKVLTDMKAGVNTVDTQFINKNLPHAIVAETSKTVATNDYIYNVSLINNNTTLRFEKASASLGLPEAVAKSNITEFDMTRDELVAEWLSPTLNDMQGDLTIMGNRHSIIADNKLEGINTNGYTLTIVEVGDLHSENVLDASMRNFDKALINTNNGTINLTHSIFTNNIAQNSFIDLDPPFEIGPDGEEITTQFVGGNGAVIENIAGTVNIDGGVFYGNKAENLGGAIYNNGNLNITASEGNRVLFENNSAMTAESLNTYANDIYQTAEGNTFVGGTGGMTYFGGGFAGEGHIIKEGVNEMVLGATSDSSKYKGEFILTEGSLTVKNGAGFFGGTSEVTGGTLNWDTAEKLTDGAQLGLNGGKTNILSNGYIILDDKININRNATVTIQEGGILENQKNNLVINGGAIKGYNDGTTTTYGTFKNTHNLELIGDNSVFKGTFLQTEGVTVIGQDSIMFSNGDLQGGTIIFNDDSTIKSDSTFTSANSDNEKTILLNNNSNASSILGTVASAENKNLSLIISNTLDTVQNINLDNINLNQDIVSLTIQDNVAYNGNITIGENSQLNLSVDNYDMKFNNNIVDLNDSSKFMISTNRGHNITIDGNSSITGNANIGEGGIIKDGSGTFTFNGDGSKYTGNFSQYGGKTVISTNGFLFNGLKNIVEGELEVNSNTGIYYNNVNLSDNTTLTHKSSTPIGGNITSDTFAFTGSNASAIFTTVDGLTTKAQYKLGNDIQNGETNKITFENSKVSLGTTDFTGSTIYEFNNSKIDLHSSNYEIKDYVFSHLNSDNSSIDLKINFIDDGGTIKLATDTLTIQNTDVAGGNIFELGNITIHDASLENGSLVYNTVNDVLQGEASFKNQQASTVVAEGATTIYEYTLSLTDTNKSIQLEGLGAADENSLNKVNIKDINRFFNFSKGTEGNPEYYYNADSLQATGKGNFVVSGATNNARDSILSGFLVKRDDDNNPIITDLKGSLFNMADETTFTIQNLTVEDTFKDGTGSVISIGTPETANNLAAADVFNIIIQRADSTGDGGAIYNNGGIINIDSSQFFQNNSDSLGGVLKNETGTVGIFNGLFGGTFGSPDTADKGNTALSGAAIATGTGSSTTISHSQFNYNTAYENGGAIHNLGNLTLTESTIFTENTATNGRGGAIYNDGNLIIASKTNSDSVFVNNKDSKGANDIYQAENGKITINGDGGKVAIMSGFAGKGEIIKEGINELVLGSTSKNSGFTGKFTQNEGFTTVEGEFFGGKSNINGGTLTWNTTTDKIKNAVLIADGGTIDISGKLTLNNNQDSLNKNSVIHIKENGLLNLEKGYVSLDRNSHNGDFANYDKWEGAITQSGGKIDYNLDTNGLLQVSGGEFNVLGGNLTLQDVEFNGKNYTSSIGDKVNLKIQNDSTLTLDSAKANLTLNTGDIWSSNSTIHLKNGALNYTNNIGNGKLIAESGRLNIFGSDLVLRNENDLIKNTVNINLNTDSSLEVKAGNVTLNSNDELHGTIKLNHQGNIVADGFTRNNNNTGLKYQQDGGNLNVKNNSNVFVASGESFIKSGDVNVNDSKLIVGPAVTDLSITNLTLENNAYFNTQREFEVTNNFNMNNSYLSTINNVIHDNSIGNLIVSSGTGAHFAIDINGREHTSDKFLIGNIETDAYGNGLVNVNNINLTGLAPMDREISLQIFNAENISNKIAFDATGNPVFTPIGNYKLFSQGGGLYNLKLIDYNPQVFRGQVATMAAYQNQIMIDNIVLDHIMLVSQEVLAFDNQNKYAATLPQFAPYQYSQKDGGIWIKNYVNFETLDMTQNLDVGNNSYGSLVGLDFPLVKLKKGWKFIPTAYVGYNGGHQYFSDVSMYQNGGQGGFMGTFLKDDFIGSIMAYAGGYGNEMSMAGFTDNTGNWFAGTASKFAYNFHPSRNLIIQPTAFASYNIFGKQNWNSQFGVLSMNSGLLNGINVAPGLNIIYGRENWSLYATFQYMYNINDNISGQAGNVDLPSIKMRHGYIEYGIGATKKWKDRFNAYAQVTLRNGGRTGIGFQLGAQYAFDLGEIFNIGKHKKAQIKVPAVKKVIKSLQPM